MSTLKFEYVGQRFHPRADATQELLLFVAPAGEIRTWAGVPRKTFDYQHGFQRTLQPGRISDVAQYFSNTPSNMSPTAVVVGFTGVVQIDAVASNAGSSAAVESVHIRVEVPDFDKVAIEELADRALLVLRHRLPAAVLAAIDADIPTAIAEAVRLQEDDSAGDESDVDSESSVDIAAGDEQDRSYLADFYAQLLGYRNRQLPWPDEKALREILYSLLKPAVIVDGQHRVFGAATVDEQMLFAVCAIPNSSWAENVYQFVVINQKAKPIKPAFLSSIVATSLSGEEIATVYDRLRTSKIDVARAEEMERVNTDSASPFRSMVDFEVEGSQGFLQFPGMTKLVRDFRNVERSLPVLLPAGAWSAATGDWMDHFFAFWRGIRRYFESADPRLWQKPTDANPNNLLKIVTLQEVQALMLDNWADSRAIQLATPAQTEETAFKFWADFPPAFFSDEWKKKGLQTSVGRKIIRDAITDTRRNAGRKNWGHRRLGLFSE